MFSSQSFIVSGLTFQSLIHFELTFVCGVNKHSNFIFLYVAVQFSQHPLLRRLPFLHCICLLPLSKVNYPQVFGYIRGLLQAILDSPGYPVALITVSDFVPNCTVLMTVALQYNLKLMRSILPALFSFLKTTLAIWDLLCFHTNCEFFGFSSMKMPLVI